MSCAERALLFGSGSAHRATDGQYVSQRQLLGRHIDLLRPLMGLKQEKCKAEVCWFITAAAWARRLPIALLKSAELTLYLQNGHLNSVPSFIGLVV
jgi:hypothetical protein